MEYLSPIGPVYQAGTLSGNPLCVSAGISTIKAIEEDNAIEKANKNTEYMISFLKDELKDYSDELTINHISSLLTIFFKKSPVNNFKDVMQSNTAKFKKFFGMLIKEGIFAAPSQYEALFLSSVHTKEDINKTIEIIKKAVKQI